MSTILPLSEVVLITPLRSLDELIDPVLVTRASRLHARRSREIVAHVAQEEAAFLSYDDWSDRGVGYVLEIFVLPRFRHHGLATRLLDGAESLALELGCKHIRLKAHSLDDDTDQAQLEAWYRRLGYRKSRSAQEWLEKSVAFAK